MNANMPQETILIVDKYSNTLAQLIATLEDQGYQVIIATKIDDAHTIISDSRNNIICSIINVIEPIDECIFCSLKKITDQENPGNIPLIVYSSKLNQKVITRFYESGIFQLIEKPCNNEHLTQIITNIAKLTHHKYELYTPTDKYKALTSSTPIEIIVLDNNNSIVEWNEATEQNNPNIDIGKNFFEICCGSDYHEIEEHPVTCCQESKKKEQGNIIISNNHKKQHFTVIATPILDSCDNITSILVQSINQTNQISMEQKLRRQVQRYNRILKEQDRTTDYLIRTQKDLQEKGAELERLSITDSLTSINNRRKFDEDLKNEALRASRYQHPLSLFIIDIDNFKKVNDTYGHLTGDIILKSLSNMLQQTVRETDIVARYGGEEFVIILPETEYETAKVISERIRFNIEHQKVPTDYGVLSVTVSIGSASIYSQDISPQQLLQQADSCLYNAKRAGKNRVDSILLD